jgi:large subunit ribosomal protein L15
VHLHDLHSPEGARHKATRVGRGTGSGRGKTSGRGQKGQLARSQGFRVGFEGGQMPLAQRLPKLPGFTNHWGTVYAAVNLSKLNRFEDGQEVGPEAFHALGLADPGLPVKILGAGHLQRKLVVVAHAASESARVAIEKKGGTLRLLGEPASPDTPEEQPAPAPQP